MSATEWLSFVSPWIIVTLILNGLAFIPLPLKKENMYYVKTTVTLVTLLLVAWLIAAIAPHIRTPLTRFNLIDTSQILFWPTLLALVVLLIRQLATYRNVLNTTLR